MLQKSLNFEFSESPLHEDLVVEGLLNLLDSDQVVIGILRLAVFSGNNEPRSSLSHRVHDLVSIIDIESDSANDPGRSLLVALYLLYL